MSNWVGHLLYDWVRNQDIRNVVLRNDSTLVVICSLQSFHGLSVAMIDLRFVIDFLLHVRMIFAVLIGLFLEGDIFTSLFCSHLPYVE